MPYVRCPDCGLHTFTVAYRADTDHCGRCHAELPRPRPRLTTGERGRFASGRYAEARPPATVRGVGSDELEVELAVRERLYARSHRSVEATELRREARAVDDG